MNLSKKDVRVLIHAHFQQLEKIAIQPFHMELNRARQDLILHTAVHYDKISGGRSGLYDYLNPDSSENLEEFYPNYDLNKLKLILLFLGPTFLTYHFEELSLSSIAVGYLYHKIADINLLSNSEIFIYLDALLNDEITDHSVMDLSTFCQAIQTKYRTQGIVFHGYLKENFYNDLDKKKITHRSQSPLFFFLPQVFCQQHINSCIISTQMSIVKQITSDLEAFQLFCTGRSMFPKIIDMSKLGKRLTLSDLRLYQIKLRELQVEYELHLATSNYNQAKLARKKYDNHFWSTLEVIAHNRILSICSISMGPILSRTNTLSSFQKKLLKLHNKAPIEQTLLFNYLKGNKSSKYFDLLKYLLLYEQRILSKVYFGVGHVLLIEMDKQGRLLMIEHKNNKPEKTVLSMNVYSEIMSHHKYDVAKKCLYALLEETNKVRQVMLNYVFDQWGALFIEYDLNVASKIHNIYTHKPINYKEYYALIGINRGSWEERQRHARQFFAKNSNEKEIWKDKFSYAIQHIDVFSQQMNSAKQTSLEYCLNQKRHDLLVNLKSFISETSWKVGMLGGEIIILEDGTVKHNIPKRVAQIYHILKAYEEEQLTLDKAITDIATCASRAGTQSFLFLRLNRRDEKTQDLYDHLKNVDKPTL